LIVLVAILTFAVCFAAIWIMWEVSLDSFSLIRTWVRER
jgi:hypothetical protein